MSAHPGPRRLWIPSSRSLVRDILHYDRQIPSFAHTRHCQLAPLAAARRQAARRVSWAVLFLKAYGLLAADCPPLRRCYMRWPWPHFYEHPESIGTLVINRPYRHEERLFWLRFRRPEGQSLAELQQRLERYAHGPAEKHFHRQIAFSRCPTPLRRLGWWTTFHLSGEKRAKRLGTFGLTTLAGAGVSIDRPPSITTSTLTYGPIDNDGQCRVTIAYDHRVMDGALVARKLAELEALLCGRLVEELRSLPQGAVPVREAA